MKNKEPLILTSPEPINDGGRKYDCVYWVLGATLGLIFGVKAGFTAFVIGMLSGVFIGWVLKSQILKSIIYRIPLIEYAVERKVPYDELMIQLVPILTSLGMTVEKSKNVNGYPVISYQGNIYDIIYDDDKNVFRIYNSQNLVRILLRFDYIGRYRKVSIAIGMIAYYTQQICKESIAVARRDVDITSGTMKFCPSCGNELSEGVKFCSNCGNTIGTQKQEEKLPEWKVPTQIQQVGHQLREREKKRKIILGIVIGLSVLFLGFSLLLATVFQSENHISSLEENNDLVSLEEQVDNTVENEDTTFQLSGQWYNVGSGRAQMSIEDLGNNQLQMEINWSSGAAYMSVWTMDGQYVYDELNEYWKIEYSNCKVVEQEYGDDGEVATEEEVQEGGTGYFYLDRNNQFVWEEDARYGNINEVFAKEGSKAILYTMEFTAWSDEYEAIIIVDYYESMDGGKMILKEQTSDNPGEWITGEFSFEEVSSGEQNRYHIYDEAGNYIQTDFATSISEHSGADILILYDMETGAEETYLEKTYAYSNVG